MTNIFAHSKIHTTYHQAKKIRRHLRRLDEDGFAHCHVVSGYPKSGNTWVARMVADAIGCEMEAYLTDVHKRLPRDSHVTPVERLKDVIVVKSHHTASLLSLGGVNSGNIVSIVRDPRDVAVSGSGFLFGSENIPNEERINQMIDLMVETQKPSVRWQDLRWDEFIQSAIDKNTLIVRYCDVQEDTVGSLHKILARLGYERSDDQIARVVKFHDFKASKLRSATDKTSETRQYFRQGKVGAYRDHLTQNQQLRIELKFKDMMKIFGYL